MSDIFDQPGAEEKLNALESFIQLQSDPDDALISVLHKAQELFGYLPQTLQLHISRRLNIPASKVYGVVSFYTYFTQEKKGLFTVSVCMGTACFVRGSEKVMHAFTKALDIKNGETTADGMFSLKDVRCIGACGLAPVVTIGDKVFGHVTEADVTNILAEYKSKGSELNAD